ncbi:GNAT family N-acetyltransferase [Noviherbaspirillum sp. CPCC 100848]|uniref:GNAT family N-acetyltransferase n=1 Tax=Noviherbaspirillum album TaxID=3080276 RepID=A0ABU6JJ57_9BURK|nr:GNAT family N-acetyltransferase [Noviherbaspirillum sp. CPCC 100848]MEC4723725.1 GNAT family N-acetyltransferase [Noviherbaspirillum sp. CPCC 100848]
MMTQADVPEVMRVQAGCYHPSMLESEGAIRARLKTVPDLSWVAQANGRISAYLVAYRSRLGKLGALGAPFNVAPDPDTLYLHDLAVDTACKGQGMGPLLVRMALDRACSESLAYSSLISVQSSRDFWERQGYSIWRRLDARQADQLRTYPGQAWYMVNTLK